MSSTPSAPSREVFAMSTGLGYFTFLKLNQLPLTQSLKLEAFYGYSYWKESFHGFGNNTPATPVDDVYAHNGRLNILARYPLGPKKVSLLDQRHDLEKKTMAKTHSPLNPINMILGLSCNTETMVETSLSIRLQVNVTMWRCLIFHLNSHMPMRATL